MIYFDRILLSSSIIITADHHFCKLHRMEMGSSRESKAMNSNVIMFRAISYWAFRKKLNVIEQSVYSNYCVRNISISCSIFLDHRTASGSCMHTLGSWQSLNTFLYILHILREAAWHQVPPC